MAIEINTTRAHIGIKTSQAALNIQQPRGQLQIKTESPKMTIDQELPRVQLSQYSCFAEAGLKNVADLRREIVEYSKAAAQEGVAQKAGEGDRMARIERGENALAEIAADNSYQPLDFNIGFIPQSRPKIQVSGYLDIQWQVGKIDTEYYPQKPTIQYLPGQVEIYLRQRPEIDINYIDEKA